MSGAKFTDELKRDAVAQVEDRGYAAVQVTVWKTGEGIYRTVADLMTELRNPPKESA